MPVSTLVESCWFHHTQQSWVPEKKGVFVVLFDWNSSRYFQQICKHQFAQWVLVCTSRCRCRKQVVRRHREITCYTTIFAPRAGRRELKPCSEHILTSTRLFQTRDGVEQSVVAPSPNTFWTHISRQQLQSILLASYRPLGVTSWPHLPTAKLSTSSSGSSSALRRTFYFHTLDSCPLKFWKSPNVTRFTLILEFMHFKQTLVQLSYPDDVQNFVFYDLDSPQLHTSSERLNIGFRSLLPVPRSLSPSNFCCLPRHGPDCNIDKVSTSFPSTVSAAPAENSHFRYGDALYASFPFDNGPGAWTTPWMPKLRPPLSSARVKLPRICGAWNRSRLRTASLELRSCTHRPPHGVSK
ncbi:hypothetical protein M011DRAFT_59152 [Sporormia fimetaria CBS 119925]|uniref:Uncharacterized protein n=1 Tax=Sporormia fimetaria CBS 119925 TaxID=1340428 RepID=A0A6A6VCU5_9PLEO|nr:hypothetical protein M011DRAFT_59152 [Sporormia fimetaria CBS 119925]